MMQAADMRNRDHLATLRWLNLACNWRVALLIVQPETVVRWHQQGFKIYWRWNQNSKLLGYEASKASVDKYSASGSRTWASRKSLLPPKDLQFVEFPCPDTLSSVNMYLIGV